MQIFFTSLLIGTLHVISGPDHLAVVSPLAANSKEKSWKTGFFWSIGHTIGVFILGIIFLLFKENINLYKLNLVSEKLVAFTVISIGILAVIKQLRKQNSKKKQYFHKHSVMAITMVGILHGLAGFSHIIGVLPTLAYPSFFQSVIYLVGFVIGTILAMVTYTEIIGIIKNKILFISNWQTRFCLTLGVISIVIGVYWLFV